ncbi:MAG: DNA cytosine methyltransferase [Thermoplasmata archaeon]
MAIDKVLDLFCGAGGLSSGFRSRGYTVTAVDVNHAAGTVFEENQLGRVLLRDLSTDFVNGGYDAVIGGPPCRPWSSINTTRRAAHHPDFSLLSRFFLHVKKNKPAVFLLENVPPARPFAERRAARLKSLGYRTESRLIRYSEFGAPTSRHRLIMFGARRGDPADFFNLLETKRRATRTVRDAIGRLANTPEGQVRDHVYPKFRTLNNYRKYYETGKFGWYILDWDLPAPSFGNVTKTYTMHPSGWHGKPPRVISVKEALLLMGFEDKFRFPDGMSLSKRYQMVVDSVSPVFSAAVADSLLAWS